MFLHFTFSKANLDYQTFINDHCRLFVRGPVSMNMLQRPTSTGWHYALQMTSSKTDGIVREYCVCFACSDITCCICLRALRPAHALVARPVLYIWSVIISFCNQPEGYITVMVFKMLVKSFYLHSRFIVTWRLGRNVRFIKKIESLRTDYTFVFFLWITVVHLTARLKNMFFSYKITRRFSETIVFPFLLILVWSLSFSYQLD